MIVWTLKTSHLYKYSFIQILIMYKILLYKTLFPQISARLLPSPFYEKINNPRWANKQVMQMSNIYSNKHVFNKFTFAFTSNELNRGTKTIFKLNRNNFQIKQKLIEKN